MQHFQVKDDATCVIMNCTLYNALKIHIVKTCLMSLFHRADSSPQVSKLCVITQEMEMFCGTEKESEP